jgi:hypothetical protein
MTREEKITELLTSNREVLPSREGVIYTRCSIEPKELLKLLMEAEDDEIEAQEIEDNQVEEESSIINDCNPSIDSYCMNPSDYYNRTLIHYTGGKRQFFELMNPPYIKE